MTLIYNSISLVCCKLNCSHAALCVCFFSAKIITIYKRKGNGKKELARATRRCEPNTKIRMHKHRRYCAGVAWKTDRNGEQWTAVNKRTQMKIYNDSLACQNQIRFFFVHEFLQATNLWLFEEHRFFFVWIFIQVFVFGPCTIFSINITHSHTWCLCAAARCSLMCVHV